MKLLQSFVSMTQMSNETLCGIDGENSKAELACYFINSITNLSRVIGLQDSMMFIRSILERTIWLSEEQREEKADKNDSLLAIPSLLFAVLHEGVFEKKDIQYVETFFDGVIHFGVDAKHFDKGIFFEFKRFPPMTSIQPNSAEYDGIHNYPRLDARYFFDPTQREFKINSIQVQNEKGDFISVETDDCQKKEGGMK